MTEGGDGDEGLVARRRVAAWVDLWMKQKEKEGIVMNPTELERRLGVGRGTGFRILAAERLGLDVFLKIRRLLRKSADSLLDDNPPGFKP